MRNGALLFLIAIALPIRASSAPVLGFVEPFTSTISTWGGQATNTNPGTGGVGGAADGYLRLARTGAFGAPLATRSDGLEYNGDWIAANVPSNRIFYRSNSLVNQLMAVRAGIGIALLPCYLADADDRIRRITGVLAEPASELWIVTHKDLRNTARIRAFLTVIGDAIVAARRAFEGQT